MKRILTLICALLIAFAFCACDSAEKSPNTNMVASEQGKGANSEPEVADDSKAEESRSFIGEQKAKELALKEAGLNEADVFLKKAELDKDDGVWQYEIEFIDGKIEYEIDIDAITGDRLSFKKDIDD